MRQLDVVVEAVLDRRSGGKLSLRPKTQDGGRQNMRAGMADPLQLGHRRTLIKVRSTHGGDVFGD